MKLLPEELYDIEKDSPEKKNLSNEDFYIDIKKKLNQSITKSYYNTFHGINLYCYNSETSPVFFRGKIRSSGKIIDAAIINVNTKDKLDVINDNKILFTLYLPNSDFYQLKQNMAVRVFKGINFEVVPKNSKIEIRLSAPILKKFKFYFGNDMIKSGTAIDFNGDNKKLMIRYEETPGLYNYSFLGMKIFRMHPPVLIPTPELKKYLKDFKTMGYLK